MTVKPTVSVIIPCYNSANTILEAIDSVLVQDYKNIEIIIINDGSTDNIETVLSLLIDKKIIRYAVQNNGGAASARNLGLKIATGDYFVFLDADDVMLPQSIENRLMVFDQYPSLEIVFADYFLTSNETRTDDLPFLEKNCFPDNAVKYCIFKKNGMYLFSDTFYHFYMRATPRPVCTNTVMISKILVKSRGVFDTNYLIGEDNDYWLRLITRNNVGYTVVPVANYLHYRSNLTSNFLKYQEEEIKYNKSLFSTVKNQLLEYLMDVLFVHREIGLLHFNIAYHFYRNGLFVDARKKILISLKYLPYNYKVYKIFLLVVMRIKRR